RCPFDEFTDQQVGAINRVKVVNNLDGGMVQAGKNASFIAEALARTLVVDKTRSQYLDCKVAPEFLVVCAVNDTHAAGADHLFNTIPPEPLARSDWHPHSAFFDAR